MSNQTLHIHCIIVLCNDSYFQFLFDLDGSKKCLVPFFEFFAVLTCIATHLTRNMWFELYDRDLWWPLTFHMCNSKQVSAFKCRDTIHTDLFFLRPVSGFCAPILPSPRGQSSLMTSYIFWLWPPDLWRHQWSLSQTSYHTLLRKNKFMAREQDREWEHPIEFWKAVQ